MRCIQVVLLLAAFVMISSIEDKSNSISPGSPAVQSNTIQKLIEILQKYGLEEQRLLKRVFLSNRSITCNDGSKSGFYLRKAHGSKRWIIFLEGGWYCYDHKTCKSRWLRLRHLMTSTQWPETRDVGGILSTNPEENPFWWNANHVFVPYCTSDSWTGTKSSRSEMFSFMGADIVQQVVRDLVPLGLDNASSLLLAGSSAGGTGVMLNLDHVQNLIHNELGMPYMTVRGISDSGWFLDRPPYSELAIPPTLAVKQGMEHWNARLPENCVKKHAEEPWRCYFGYHLYPTLTAPLFVFQWLFDEAQMTAENVGAPVTKQQWDYIHKMGNSLRRTFENVTAVFAPSCISHSVLTKRDWQLVKIDEISLAQALYCWEQMPIEIQRSNETNLQIETNQPCAKSIRQLLRSGGSKSNGTSLDFIRGERNHTSVSSRYNAASVGRKGGNKNMVKGFTDGMGNKKRRRRKHKGRRRERNREHRRREHMKEKQERRREHMKEKEERRKGGGGRRHKHGNGGKHGNNHTKSLNGTRLQRSVISSNKRKCAQTCHFRLIERCTWPQCNHSCPKLHNPFTGEEMDFIELLKSFGLDMSSVASALGVDLHTLNNMDHDELLNLLTQQTN